MFTVKKEYLLKPKFIVFSIPKTSFWLLSDDSNEEDEDCE
jgi:hypothetical protein